MSELDRNYTITEAAELLSVHPATVRRWISQGRLRAWRYGPGRIIRISERDLLKLRRPVTSLSEAVA